MTELASMVEQQIAFVRRALSRMPLLPVPVVHAFHSVEAEPLLALSKHLQSLDFQVSQQQRACTDEAGLQYVFHDLHAQQETIVEFVHLHAAATRAYRLAEEFGVHYRGFFIDVAVLQTDA